MITLLTDFGNDAYAGIMKGVIYNLHPDANIVDISHHVEPQSVDEAAFILNTAYPYFPDGTIHCVVVDPGVGSDRPILIVRTKTAIFLAPDNGVLSYILDKEINKEIFKVTNTSYFLDKISSTFHGRDIFAPVAARLDQDVSPEELGEPVKEHQTLNTPKPIQTENNIFGHILYFDHFGNAITNIPEHLLSQFHIQKLKLGNITLGQIQNTYADVADQTPLALIGSHNHLEIAIRNGNAREQLRLQKGQTIEIE